jgi:predicted GH43/DUF377 family glycosyl hydrolase
MKYLFFLLVVIMTGCKNSKINSSEKSDKAAFAKELVEFQPYKNNPIFTHGAPDAWDSKIRERGYILLEDSIYKMWYTGYKGDENNPKFLGYATSKDGIHWDRYPGNPIFNEKWTEDVFVTKNDGKYYMYAEGKNDVAHLLTSDDGIKWNEQGDLVIRKVNGDTIPGPYGTPTVWIEDGKWYLFYEVNDSAIWLAVSNDHKTWTNVNDEPVIKPGPEKYDLGAVAANQVVKYKGKYYLYYHANGDPGWLSNPSPWTSNVAMSTDLIHWTKYPDNPLVEGDHSSPVTVFDGKQFRLYTIHPDVSLYFGAE